MGVARGIPILLAGIMLVIIMSCGLSDDIEVSLSLKKEGPLYQPVVSILSESGQITVREISNITYSTDALGMTGYTERRTYSSGNTYTIVVHDITRSGVGLITSFRVRVDGGEFLGICSYSSDGMFIGCETVEA